MQGSSPPQWKEILDATAPNAQCMLQSWIPSVIKKCPHYWITPETKRLNLQRVLSLLYRKDMPKQWWTGNLRKGLNKWGDLGLYTVPVER